MDDERAHRKRMCAIGYRAFGALRWGQLGDGHISARDPERTDHFWLLDWAFRSRTPRSAATMGSEAAGLRYFQWLQRNLVPDPTVVD